MKQTACVVLSLSLIALAGLHCGPTTVTYERNAIVDAPSLPSRTGAPLKWGELRAAFEVNPWLVAPRTNHAGELKFIDSYQMDYTDDEGNHHTAWKNTYSDRSSSLITPRAQFGGHIYYGLCDYVEMGIQGMYGPYDISYKSLHETRDFPLDQRDGTWKFGIGVRFNIPIKDSGFTLSILNEWNLVRVSEHTVMTLEEGVGPTSDWVSVNSWVDSDVVLRPVLGIQGTYEFVDWLHGYLFGVFQLATRNHHVVKEERSEAPFLLFELDSMESYPIFDVGLGLEFQYSYGFFNVAGFYPVHALAYDIQQGPGILLQVGVNLPMLGPNAITRPKAKGLD